MRLLDIKSHILFLLHHKFKFFMIVSMVITGSLGYYWRYKQLQRKDDFYEKIEYYQQSLQSGYDLQCTTHDCLCRISNALEYAKYALTQGFSCKKLMNTAPYSWDLYLCLPCLKLFKKCTQSSDAQKNRVIISKILRLADWLYDEMSNQTKAFFDRTVSDLFEQWCVDMYDTAEKIKREVQEAKTSKVRDFHSNSSVEVGPLSSTKTQQKYDPKSLYPSQKHNSDTKNDSVPVSAGGNYFDNPSQYAGYDGYGYDSYPKYSDYSTNHSPNFSLNGFEDLNYGDPVVKRPLPSVKENAHLGVANTSQVGTDGLYQQPQLSSAKNDDNASTLPVRHSGYTPQPNNEDLRHKAIQKTRQVNEVCKEEAERQNKKIQEVLAKEMEDTETFLYDLMHA